MVRTLPGRRIGGAGVKGRVLCSGLTLLLAAAHPVVADDGDGRQRKAKIAELTAQRQGQSLDVSYRVRNGFTEEVAEKIQAGIPVTFRHRVEVTVRHFLPLWPSRTIASASIETQVVYDSLTHRYELTRVTEVTARGEGKSEPEERHESTVSEERMRSWMTEMTEIPSLDLSTLPEDTTARVRVECTLGRRWVLLVPARRTVTAELKLER